ncbi:anthranilate synthase alpha subunit 1, chloroplastic-like isoform X2 [Carex rostrata]
MQSLSTSSLLPSPRQYSTTARSTTTTFHIPQIHFSPRHHLQTFKCFALVQHFEAVAENEEAAKFTEAAKKGNLVPLQRTIFSDHLTPVLAYRCLIKDNEHDVPSFLFESVQQGSEGTSVGRYSVVGAQPAMEIVAEENLVSILDHEEERMTEEVVADPMSIPQRIMEDWTPQLIDDLPNIFCGGWVGYFSYDTVRYAERKKLPFVGAPFDDRKLPDMHLGLYTDVIVFDHVEKKVHVIHWVRLNRFYSVKAAYHDGISRLATLLSRVHNLNVPTLSAGSIVLSTCQFGSALKSTMSTEGYKHAVLEVKEHIQAGDVFQVVLSQRFERRTLADPFEVYRALRIVNPSPYMAYIQARGCILVASSPEILISVCKRKIVSRPLAGTIRRGKTKEQDMCNEEKLLNDAKQCAEHVMLVDLGRNDVGKVTGELLDDLSCWDALRAALPVGTVSGAPKVRAMELIDKLEVLRRGPYSGGFGSVSFMGDMDIAIALRTIVFPTGSWLNTLFSYRDTKQRQEWLAHIQAGAGIVADSIPDDEQQECENKAAALARAIDLAESAFVEKSGFYLL